MSRRGRNFSGATPLQPGHGMGEDKYLDTNTPAVDTLYNFMSSLCAASILKSAQDLEIFDVLEEGGPLSAENLAQKKGYYAKSTERLLNTLTSMKLITKESRKSGAQALFGNSEAGKLLAKANPNTLKEIISWMGFFDEGLKQLPEVVKKGPEGFRHDFDEAMENTVDVAEMKKCAHGRYHDNAGNSYDETGKLVHCHGGKTEETKVTDSMEKCQHGNFHDKEGAVYDETGKKIHGPGGDTENQKSATQTKSTENMDKCKHGNFHDEDGTVYDEAGNKIHGPGGEHGGEGEEEENYECGDSIDYYQGMHNLLGASSAKLMTAIDLSEHKSAVDLGGGSGVLCFELKRQYPDMDVTLFELEGVAKIFNERFLPGNEKLGVKVIPGDWNKTPLPAAELYILSQVVHDIDNSGELLKKVYKAIKPGGGILLLEHTLADDKVSLMPPAMWDILMMTHGGCLRSPAEFRMWLTDLGFLDVSVIRTQENNEYDIIYAKKPEHSQNKKSKK